MVKRPLRPIVKVLAPAPVAERPISLPLEIGLVTSASFAITALTNGLIFWRRWNVDYFSIATPSDVVMSGIPTALGMVAVAVMLTVAFTLASTTIRRTLWGRRIDALALQNARKVFGRILIASLILSVAHSWFFIATNRDAITEGSNGLFTAFDSDLPRECRGRRVAWLGSNAALVECRDHMRVVRDLDGVDFLIPSTFAERPA